MLSHRHYPEVHRNSSKCSVPWTPAPRSVIYHQRFVKLCLILSNVHPICYEVTIPKWGHIRKECLNKEILCLETFELPCSTRLPPLRSWAAAQSCCKFAKHAILVWTILPFVKKFIELFIVIAACNRLYVFQQFSPKCSFVLLPTIKWDISI